MSDTVKEKLTSKGVNVLFERAKEPEAFKIDAKSEVIKYGSLNPPNMEKPDGPPMKLLVGDGVSIELSKRRAVMPFWHRNMDFDEVIICVKGQATWKTENGEYQLNAGEMLYIPRGMAHTAAASSDSDYMAIEIKASSKLENKSAVKQ
ncbi:MAG TPA: cupin domain-containing protein [Thermoplasmataceae archaeon]|nr:cupin domain-containing protein [Thermoplasmataceae archaeon]